MRNVYLAYSMTNSNQDLSSIFQLTNWLKKSNYKVIQPEYILFSETLVDKTLRSIEQAHVIIADLSVYSHGVGFELGYAYAIKRNILTVCNLSSKDMLSKFVLGLFPDILFYLDGNDLVQQVEAAIKKHI